MYQKYIEDFPFYFCSPNTSVFDLFVVQEWFDWLVSEICWRSSRFISAHQTLLCLTCLLSLWPDSNILALPPSHSFQHHSKYSHFKSFWHLCRWECQWWMGSMANEEPQRPSATRSLLTLEWDEGKESWPYFFKGLSNESLLMIRETKVCHHKYTVGQADCPDMSFVFVCWQPIKIQMQIRLSWAINHWWTTIWQMTGWPTPS